MLNHSQFVALVLLSALLRPAPCAAADAPAMLAQVNGEAITLVELDEELANLPAAGGTAPKPEAVLRRLVQNRLLAQEGYRLGLAAEPAVRNRVEDLRRLRAVVALLDSISAPVAAAGALELDSLMSRSSELRHVAHILVGDEASALALRDSLAAGTPFAELARRHSTDGTAARGGELGWRPAGAFVPDFEAGLANLAPGEVSVPVRTEFGWHLITLLGTRVESAGQSAAMREAMHKTLERESRMAAVREYVAGLRRDYGVVVNDSLLASLDFGSQDPAVLAAIRESDTVLAMLPTGRLTVQGLYRQIIFKYFHGLAGRPEADQLRDKVFNEWVDEALLSYEARRLGLTQAPALLAEAGRLERSLLHEEVIKTLLLGATREEPAPAALEAFYAADPARYAPAARVKVRSVAFADSVAAAAFRARLAEGAQFSWLAARDPAARPGPAPYGEDWIEPATLGLADAELAEGALVGPLPLEDGWALAQVQARERVTSPSFADCRGAVLTAYQHERQQEALRQGLARLEAAATITYAPAAETLVAARLAERAARATAAAAGQTPAGGQR